MADRHSGPKNGGSSLPIAKYKSCPVHLHAHLVDSLRPATAVANLIRNLILLESGSSWVVWIDRVCIGVVSLANVGKFRSKRTFAPNKYTKNLPA